MMFSRVICGSGGLWIHFCWLIIETRSGGWVICFSGGLYGCSGGSYAVQGGYMRFCKTSTRHCSLKSKFDLLVGKLGLQSN